MAAPPPVRLSPVAVSLAPAGAIARLGLIALATDLTLERDAARLIPGTRAALHVTRVVFDNPTTPENLLSMRPRLTAAAALILPEMKLAAIGYGCTAASVVIGSEAIRDAIHAARGRAAAIVINPGAFTHYAWAIHDALAAFEGPVVEVHISNPNAREPWRHTSVVSPVATGTIAGLGMHGYELGVAAIARTLGLT